VDYPNEASRDTAFFKLAAVLAEEQHRLLRTDVLEDLD
jgi:hypothetical protein